MMTGIEEISGDEPSIADTELKRPESPEDITLVSSNSSESANQLVTRGKFISHHPKAGVNPLVDSASYLFSIIGRLKQVRSYRHLNKLHKELITEINAFQEIAKSHGYSSEYILVSRYALCATLDDIITHTAWGAEGQWDNYSMLAAFNQDSAQQERFFIILERLVKDPSLYIELMEFMYLCLCLGFKGSYRQTESSNTELEQICNALYKRIRAYHGDFSKTLSPFPVKPAASGKSKTQRQKKPAIGFAMITTACIILVVFIGLGFLLDTISNQAYQELLHIGKSLLYETHDS
ncbi:MAG TPA: type IVB secretion system protein IcmH/DotU [Gammaproteobacteria bacterium]|nr:type IVB secretion system protein IcmH/DotU [Gammaproteobacteria bacterium]